MPVPPITATGRNSFREERMSTTLRLHPEDGVVIARTTLMPGAPVADGIQAAARIPAGHKVATRPHGVGEPVRRYNQIIGRIQVWKETPEPRSDRGGGWQRCADDCPRWSGCELNWGCGTDCR